MPPPIEVSYTNLSPSQALDGRVREQFLSLQLDPSHASCHASFSRPRDESGLMLCIELTTEGGAIAAQRLLKTGRGERSVCAAIDSAFQELSRLVSQPQGSMAPRFLELALA